MILFGLVVLNQFNR